MSSYQYRKSHCGDKTILRPSYLHNGISYTGKTTSLYWIGAQHPWLPRGDPSFHDSNSIWCYGVSNHPQLECLLKMLQANKVIITIYAKWLVLCKGINRWRMDSHHKGTVMQKTISLHNVILQMSHPFKWPAAWMFAQQIASGVCHNSIKTKSRFVRACTGERGNASLMAGFPPQRDSNAVNIVMYDVIMRAPNKTNFEP